MQRIFWDWLREIANVFPRLSFGKFPRDGLAPTLHYARSFVSPDDEDVIAGAMQAWFTEFDFGLIACAQRDNFEAFEERCVASSRRPHDAQASDQIRTCIYGVP